MKGIGGVFEDYSTVNKIRNIANLYSMVTGLYRRNFFSHKNQTNVNKFASSEILLYTLCLSYAQLHMRNAAIQKMPSKGPHFKIVHCQSTSSY